MLMIIYGVVAVQPIAPLFVMAFALVIFISGLIGPGLPSGSTREFKRSAEVMFEGVAPALIPVVVIVAHHAEQAKELFPAVLASALAGEVRDHASQIVTRPTREHRQIEIAWARFEPALKNLTNGREATSDAGDVHTLAERYRAHATYEEQEFLPLSQTTLMWDLKHMSALGWSFHTRHALPEVLARISRRFRSAANGRKFDSIRHEQCIV